MWRPPRTLLGVTEIRQVLFVTPWGDQGLGIQAREYTQWAHGAKWGVHVWALESRKTGFAQVNSAEWTLPNVKIVYTQHSDPEPMSCIQYCINNGITDVFVLEPARRLVFDFARELKLRNLQVWGIPNLEMIRRSDLPEYSTAFTGILCVNEHVRDNLLYFKIPSSMLHSWPFQLHDCPKAQSTPCKSIMRFLIVGGFNADRRKQAKKVMVAFSRAFRDRKDVQLTVLSQGGPDFQQIPPTFSNIQVRTGAMTYEQIIAEYQQHHVVIMCSRAEGLGLPFYEAMRAGCAIISLNVAMYRELVVHGSNGWLIKCATEPVALGQAAIGNNEAIVHTYTFESSALEQLLLQLTPEAISFAQTASRRNFESRLNSHSQIWANFS